MSVIRIEKISEVYIRIYTEEAIEHELSEAFCFDVPGAKFTPKFKARLWDGKIRLYSNVKKTLYAGLYPYVELFARENGYKIEFVENQFFKAPFTKNDIDIEELSLWIDSLNISSDGEDIDARDYQLNAIYEALTNKRLMVVSPTASGKSFIIYCIVRWLLERDIKIMLVVPSVSLVKQMYLDFADYSAKTDWDIDRFVHQIYGGKEKDFKKLDKIEITLENGSTVLLHGSENIKLLDNSIKLVSQLEEGDDIDENYIYNLPTYKQNK